jgi:3-methyladenine DNA glycosylase AlkD
MRGPQGDRPIEGEVRTTLAWLERRGSKRNREGMARYAIRSDKMFGVSVATLRGLAKRLGRNHDLAAVLWATGWYEARMLASFVDEPERVTPAQMDRWSRDFDNWAICDTVCFHLFDRTPHAWRKIALWSRRRDEFVKRAALALLASVAAHDKRAPDEPFAKALLLVERAAGDERNFVKKAVSWALRTIGNRSSSLHAEAMALAARLAASPDATRRWIGKDAVRDLSSPATARRLAARSRVAKK